MKTKLLIQTYETMWDIETHYCFEKNKTDSKILIFSDVESFINEIEVHNSESKSELEQIKESLKIYWGENSFHFGLPAFKTEGELTAKIFNEIIDEIKNEFKVATIKAEENKTSFIDFLKENELHPTPSGGNKYSWVARCPYGRRNHFMMVSTKENTFGCGYCKKQGGQKELEQFLNITL